MKPKLIHVDGKPIMTYDTPENHQELLEHERWFEDFCKRTEKPCSQKDNGKSN